MQLSKYRQKLEYLLSRKKKYAGRNNLGQITVAHQGGGHCQKYRKITFDGIFPPGYVCNFEYDPNRSARLARICYFENNKKLFYYILAPQNLKILDFIKSSSFLQKEDSFKDLINLKQIGHCYLIKELTAGDYIYNVEAFPKQGALFARAGGTSVHLVQKKTLFSIIKLPSGEYRKISNECKAFLGNLGNEDHTKIIWKKAGKSRWLNIRPTVRGVAKNPVDHPHGGNTSGGCHPVTPWSRLTKGQPTRKTKNKYIVKI